MKSSEAEPWFLRGSGQHPLCPVEQQGAVGKPSERVVERLVAQLFL